MDSLSLDEINKKARGYALRLFKFRPRSEAELKDKLLQHGYSPEVSALVVGEFKTLGFVDDAAFARAWLQSRLKKYGYRRVSLELLRLGLAKDLIAAAWAQIRGDYDELAIARDIAGRRVRLYKGLPVVKSKKRLMDYLARRGYSAETINKVVKEL